MASSTAWASWARASSSTGRPWQARRTPLTTFWRLNGSVTPLRLMTASVASSTVVNRRPQSWQLRRRRMTWPSSCSRESTTRESGWRQYGHRISGSPPLSPSWAGRRRRVDFGLGTSCGPAVDDGPQPVDHYPQIVDDLHQCNYYM